jgi:hypothetical protein
MIDARAAPRLGGNVGGPVPYRCYDLDHSFTLARRWPRRSLAASVAGLRVELVAVASDRARLRLRDERTDVAREVSHGPAADAIVFEDYEIAIERIVRRSWRSADVELIVRERPCPDEVFASLSTPSWTSNRCSPRDEAEPVPGIRIRAPRRVVVEPHEHRGMAGESRGHAKVVLAGAWHFAGEELEAMTLAGRGHVERAFTVRVRREADAREETAPMSRFSFIVNEVTRPPPDPAAPALRHFAVGGYFNVDVGALIAPAPTSRGAYVVSVEGGAHRSNEVRILVGDGP